MTVTQELQKYVNEIYGKETYEVKHESFKGFHARSIDTKARPPHSITLGISTAHAESKLDDIADAKQTNGSYGQA